MTEIQNHDQEKLMRLAESLASDLNEMSDDEILAEAKENGEDIDAIASHVSALISNVIHEAGAGRLAAARKAYDERQARHSVDVSGWSLDKKRMILNQVAKNDNSSQQNLTLAARSGEDSEADIDSLLQDLMDIGAIDDEGNPV